jgi:hypothetical protein
MATGRGLVGLCSYEPLTGAARFRHIFKPEATMGSTELAANRGQITEITSATAPRPVCPLPGQDTSRNLICHRRPLQLGAKIGRV